MKKAFATLYIFIVIAILFGGWCIDALWKHYHPSSPLTPNDQMLIDIIELQIQQRLAKPKGETDENTNDLLSKKVTVFQFSDLAGTEWLERLNNNEVVITQRNESTATFYKKVHGTELVLAIDSEMETTEKTLYYYLLLLVFYVFIAAVIYIWMWPLFRDLSSLEKHTSTLGKHSTFPKVSLHHRSNVAFLETAFNDMSERVEELISQREEMTYAVSHELRTPLARIKFLLEMAKHERDSTELDNKLNAINSDITHLETFINSLLNYAHFDKNEDSLQRESGDVISFCQTIVESYQQKSKKLEIQSDRNSLIIDADWQLLETAVSNLIENALRFADTSVLVNVKRQEGRVLITVEDDGPGLADNELEHIFDAFTRGSQATKRDGYGLGLAIVKRIINWHGGSVKAENRHHGGAKFTVVFPHRPPSTD